MSCDEFRRQCDADPRCEEPAYLEHSKTCGDCARYLESVSRLDATLLQAMKLPVPSYSAGRERRARGPLASPGFRWAVAATVVVALAFGNAWFGREEGSGRALAREVIAHIVEEPEALMGERAVSAADVARTLAVSNARLVADIGEVIHAEICLFRGRLVPHLVVASDAGRVTVLIVPDERAPAAEIAGAGMRGRLVPSGGHSIAVVGTAALPRRTPNRIAASIEWGI